MYDEDVETMDRDDVAFEPPKDFAVILFNDNYTTMELVIEILRDVFRKTPEDAERIMLDVHEKGQAEAYRGSWDIAETKRRAALSIAQKAGFPLKVEAVEL
jgi:ATP-dependent Clp protease adaptor protein ClpS